MHLTYNYTDANWNVAAQVTRTVNIVDTTNPVVSVTWSNPESIFVNGIFTDSWASWTDNVDVSGTILTATSWTVDNSTPWIYTLTYLYTDTSWNTHSVSRTVNVVTWDTPIINVVGNSVITQEVWLAYTDVWAEYSDTEDWTGSIIWVWSVDINTVSSYNIDYDYTDFSWNLWTQVTRTVNIVDTTSPIISLAWTGVISIFRNGTYIEQWATCTDNYDIACSVQISGIVDTSVLWSYIVSYDSEDANNNLATTVTRTVNVISWDTPIINLTGSWTIIQEVWSSFTDLWAIANDTEDGAISIIWSWTVDTSSLWTYILTYDYTDFSSNIATQVTRTINIVDTTAPVVNVTGSNPETIFVNATFVDSWATWTDNVDISGSITSAMSWSVDVTSPWAYTLTYSYTDTSWNTHLATRIVNVVTWNTPIINVVWDSVITQEVLSSYTDVWAEYSDIEDGTWSLLAVWSVNTNLVWVYNLTYDYTDFSWNIATQATRTVNIVDTTNPVIVLNWSWNITQEVGSPYTDLWAVFTDNVDWVWAVSTVGAVDINTVWSYPLIYNYTDANWNIATQVIRTVNIVDTTDPVISLNGSTTITQEVGSVYTDASAIMTDNYDSSSTISANWIVNINTVWTYNLTYDYTDTNWNVADQVTRTVNIVDTTNPILSLVWNDPVSIFVNWTFIDDWATWVDNVDGSWNIVTATSWSVDPSIPWVYTLTYEYTDSSWNIQSIIRIVNVEAWEIPIINVVWESNITQEVTSVYVDEWAEYSDIEDGTWSLAWVWTVDINTVWAYEITYSYTDFSWNDAVEVTRIVNILDTEKPVVTTTWNSVMTHYLGEDYIDDWATCSDNYDTNCSIVTSWEVNISLLWEYIITYTVTDSSWNISESIRTVTVIRSPSSTSSSWWLTSSARMDICNETWGDFSWDYYDGLCENESQINVMEEVEVTETTIGDDDNLDNDFSEDDTENEEKTEDLIAEVVIDTSENNMDELGDINEEESEKIVNDNSEVTIKDIWTEIVMTKEINSEVVNYSLINNYQVCSIIDNLLDENYIDWFDTQLIDIVNSDYKKLIMSLEKAWVVTWTQEGTFEWNRDISRVEFLKFVLRSHCIEYRNEDPSFLEFRDLDNSTWQAKVVKKSVELWIANWDLDENGNKVFRADDIISSIEATKILMRMALIQKWEEPSTQYLDLEIEWHNKYVKQWEYLWVFSAEDDNYKFNPNDWINRNKTVEFLYKVIKLYR